MVDGVNFAGNVYVQFLRSDMYCWDFSTWRENRLTHKAVKASFFHPHIIHSDHLPIKKKKETCVFVHLTIEKPKLRI